MRPTLIMANQQQNTLPHFFLTTLILRVKTSAHLSKPEQE